MDQHKQLERIFTFWTGATPINSGRSRALETIHRTGLQHVHVAGEDVRAWETTETPFHPAFKFLSEVHKADYLRCYFMHFHGGGYTDIKFHSESWNDVIDATLRRPWLVGAGYREVRGGTPYLENHVIDGRRYILSHGTSYYQARVMTNAMRGARYLMIGNGAFFFKPNSWFTRYWYGELCRRLDLLMPTLVTSPPQHARDRLGGLTGFPYAGYPVPWSFLLGDILGPLSLLSFPALSRSLPEISMVGYID